MNNQEYKIEKDIPIKKSAAGRTFRWPLDKMKVGESFFHAEKNKDTAVGLMQNIRSTCSGRKRRLGQEYSVCMVDGGFRCWRTK